MCIEGVDSFTLKINNGNVETSVRILWCRGKLRYFNPCFFLKVVNNPPTQSPSHQVLTSGWPRGLKPHPMISSFSSTMDNVHRASVTYLVNTTCGGTKQVKHCKISPSTKLQLYNVHTKKFFVRKTCEIKVFRKVDQIVDKTK